MRGLELRKGTDRHRRQRHRAGHRPSAGPRSDAADRRVAGRRLPVHRAEPARSAAARTCASARRIGYAIDRQAIVEYLRRGLAAPAAGILPPVSWAFEPAMLHVHLRSGAGARAARRGRLSPTRTATARSPVSSDAEGLEHRVQSPAVRGDPAESARGRHRARRPDLRVRDAVRRRPERELPAVHAAVGRRRGGRSGHPAPGLPLDADAAGGLQPRVLQQSDGRSTARRSGRHRPTRNAGVSCTERCSGRSRRRRRTSVCGTRPTSRWPSGRSPASRFRRSPTSLFSEDVARVAPDGARCSLASSHARRTSSAATLFDPALRFRVMPRSTSSSTSIRARNASPAAWRTLPKTWAALAQTFERLPPRRDPRRVRRPIGAGERVGDSASPTTPS